MIYSVVTMIIKENKMDEFIAECKKIRPLVLAEEGCLMYEYSREMEVVSPLQEKYTENRITLFEKWKDQAALDAHSKMEYMDSFALKVKPLRESVQIRSGVEAF